MSTKASRTKMGSRIRGYGDGAGHVGFLIGKAGGYKDVLILYR